MVNILQFCVTVCTDTYIALAQSLSFEKLERVLHLISTWKQKVHCKNTAKSFGLLSIQNLLPYLLHFQYSSTQYL